MAMTIALVDESHNPIGDVLIDEDGVITQALQGITDGSSICVRFIDPYGDTVYNPLQAAVLLCEWRELKVRFMEQDAIRLWTNIQKMIEHCSEEPHTYMKFVGD